MLLHFISITAQDKEQVSVPLFNMNYLFYAYIKGKFRTDPVNYVILQEKLSTDSHIYIFPYGRAREPLSHYVFLFNFGLTDPNFMSFLAWAGRRRVSLGLHFSGPFKTCKMPAAGK